MGNNWKLVPLSLNDRSLWQNMCMYFLWSTFYRLKQYNTEILTLVKLNTCSSLEKVSFNWWLPVEVEACLIVCWWQNPPCILPVCIWMEERWSKGGFENTRWNYVILLGIRGSGVSGDLSTACDGLRPKTRLRPNLLMAPFRTVNTLVNDMLPGVHKHAIGRWSWHSDNIKLWFNTGNKIWI